MAYLAPKWEPAWHPGKKRYYFQDRVTGKSSWSRPSGCTIQLPKQKPEDNDFEIPPPPENIPEGWACAFDWSHKRHYYYNIARPEERIRSWLRPAPVPGWSAVEAERVLGAKEKKGYNILATYAWDAESFKHRIQEAHAAKDLHILRDILMEVEKSNQTLLWGRANIPVPTTVSVKFADCLRALQEQKIEDYGAEPKISISHSTLAESVAFFAGQDPRRVVCCINPADGQVPGGAYLVGDRGTEEDLCRRVPAMHFSLLEAKKEHLYPFGPSTCHAPEHPNQYSDVLFTPRILMARGDEAEGYPILPVEKRVQVSIISAAPPRVRVHGEPATQELLSNAVMTLYVAPVYKEPRCTTLILTPWGCGLGVKDEDMITFLVKGLIGELPGIPIKLGRLYHEVHFAIPPTLAMGHAADTRDLPEIFRKVLQVERIPYVEL